MVNLDSINLAAFLPQTFALGPGSRAALWVQGCPFQCPGCISPEWQSESPHQSLKVNQIVEWITNTPSISGLTISGGEPFQQAGPLSLLISKIKLTRDLNIIVYSGYTLEQLIKRIPHSPEIGLLLDQIDVLIDGPYQNNLDDNKGLRGSSNQRVHHITTRLSGFDFNNTPRTVEFHIQNNSIVLAGIPPAGILQLFQGLTGHKVQDDLTEEVINER